MKHPLYSHHPPQRWQNRNKMSFFHYKWAGDYPQLLSSFHGRIQSFFLVVLAGLFYACLLYTVIGIAKLLERAMGADWNRCAVRASDNVIGYLVWKKSKPGPSQHLLLYLLNTPEDGVQLTKEDFAYLWWLYFSTYLSTHRGSDQMCEL